MLDAEKNFFNQILIFLGINAFARRVAISFTSSPTKLGRKKDGRYLLRTSALKVITESRAFTPGEEFIEKTTDGRKIKSKIFFDEDTMFHIQLGNKPIKIERRFFNDELVEIVTCNGVVCTSWYEAIEKKDKDIQM